jgi:mannose-1-phosphate guanylyltransferase
MLQHTLDRVARLSPPARTVTVIARGHRAIAMAQLNGRPRGQVILQPDNRDTAPGIFLALTYVRARDPGATVALFPSDHFVYPEGRFLALVRRAVRAAKVLPDRVVLLGVRPHGLELEYGWIEQSEALGWINGQPLRAVRAFLEKPGVAAARAALASGALWNTFVLAGRVGTLWEIGWKHVPELMGLFEELGKVIGTRHEEAVLEGIYRRMPARNFSSHLLQRTASQVAVMELSGVLWNDWGSEGRVLETLRRIGKLPLFPKEYLSQSDLVGSPFVGTEDAPCSRSLG